MKELLIYIAQSLVEHPGVRCLSPNMKLAARDGAGASGGP